jgi:chromosome segregation ATPase
VAKLAMMQEKTS